MSEQAEYETITRTIDYEMAKSIVWNYFSGAHQPVSVILKALEMISEEDYNAIQALVNKK